MTKLFEPVASHTLTLTASTSGEVTGLSGTANSIRLYNAGSATVFVRWGTTAQTAVTTDMAIAPGAVECFTKNNATRLAAISASAGTLYITTGDGR
jgi:hypothetical protein